jgi:hypothetical protein
MLPVSAGYVRWLAILTICACYVGWLAGWLDDITDNLVSWL